MHPLPFPARDDNPGPAEVCQVTRNLRLVFFQDLDEEANANLIVADQIQYPKPSPVRQRDEEALHVEFR